MKLKIYDNKNHNLNTITKLICYSLNEDHLGVKNEVKMNDNVKTMFL